MKIRLAFGIDLNLDPRLEISVSYENVVTLSQIHLKIQFSADFVGEKKKDHMYYYLHCNSLLLLANFQLALYIHICQSHMLNPE